MGYAFSNPEMIEEAVRKITKTHNIEGTTIKNGTAYFLKKGVEQHFLTDSIDPSLDRAHAQSTIPVLIQRHIENHPINKLGYNVLFLDGHVEWFKVEEAPEVVKAFRKALALDEPVH